MCISFEVWDPVVLAGAQLPEINYAFYFNTKLRLKMVLNCCKNGAQ